MINKKTSSKAAAFICVYLAIATIAAIIFVVLKLAGVIGWPWWLLLVWPLVPVLVACVLSFPVALLVASIKMLLGKGEK